MAGRPRKHDYQPGDPRAAQRAHIAALKARGGRRLVINLEPEEAAALERLRAAHALTTDRDAVALAISQAARHL